MTISHFSIRRLGKLCITYCLTGRNNNKIKLLFLLFHSQFYHIFIKRCDHFNLLLSPINTQVKPNRFRRSRVSMKLSNSNSKRYISSDFFGQYQKYWISSMAHSFITSISSFMVKIIMWRKVFYSMTFFSKMIFNNINLLLKFILKIILNTFKLLSLQTQ